MEYVEFLKSKEHTQEKTAEPTKQETKSNTPPPPGMGDAPPERKGKGQQSMFNK